MCTVLERCHKCGKATPMCRIDGKPSYPGAHNFDRLECGNCYGDGWTLGPCDDACEARIGCQYRAK
jgi:hypothetical protein